MEGSLTRRTLALGLVGWLALCFAAAGLGAVASVNAGDFYGSLARPSWAPPASLFGPVWTVLYFLMGVAAWLVWKQGGFTSGRAALGLFLAQLLANALWTWIFFAWRQGALAFAEILLLWVMIVATIALFRRASRLGGALLLPYLAWVSYAAALTYAVWQRNPGVLS
jgi:translocator protein